MSWPDDTADAPWSANRYVRHDPRDTNKAPPPESKPPASREPWMEIEATRTNAPTLSFRCWHCGGECSYKGPFARWVGPTPKELRLDIDILKVTGCEHWMAP